MFLSNALKSIDGEAIAVYMILRADAETGGTSISKSIKKDRGLLVSGLDAKTLSDRLGSNPLTIQRLLNTLTTHGWMTRLPLSKKDHVYELGLIENFEDNKIADYRVVWHVDKLLKPKPARPRGRHTDVIRDALRERDRRIEAIRESRVHLTDKAKRRAAAKTGVTAALEEADARTVSDDRRLLRDIQDHADIVLRHEMDPLAEGGYAKVYVCLKRLLKWNGADLRKARSYAEWLISNWDEIKLHIPMVGPPTFGAICTKSVFERCQQWRQHGFPTPASEPVTDVDGIAYRGDEAKYETDPEGL